MFVRGIGEVNSLAMSKHLILAYHLHKLLHAGAHQSFLPARPTTLASCNAWRVFRLCLCVIVCILFGVNFTFTLLFCSTG